VHLLAVFVARELGPRHGNDAAIGRQPVLDVEMEEGRDQLALGEIAPAAEDDDVEGMLDQSRLALGMSCSSSAAGARHGGSE